MKRIMLFIFVLLLMIDLADDGFFGKVEFYLPYPSAKTSITPSLHPDSGQIDFRHEIASTDLSRSFRHGDVQPVTLRVLPTLQIMHCCHLNSSGGIPL